MNKKEINLLKKSLYTYLIKEDVDNRFEKHISFADNKLIINANQFTDVLYEQGNNCEIAIIGLCVDSKTEIDRYDIPKRVLSKEYENEKQIINFFNRFAGRYIVLYKNTNNIYAFCDATAKLQLNYYEGSNVCISNLDKVVAEERKCSISKETRKLLSKSVNSLALPNDITMYEDVKLLLPNHVLDLKNGKSIRVKIDIIKVNNREQEDKLIEESSKLIENIVSEYLKYTKLVCPLTSGYDSRVAFAYLVNETKDFECYTMMHKGFTEETPDVYVADNICKEYDIEYFKYEDIKASDEFYENVKQIIGEDCDRRSVDISCTLMDHLSGLTIVGGDIIGQIGKSSVSNSLSTKFATPRFFQCKIHNTNNEVRKFFKEYIDEIKSVGDFDIVYDLFSIDNRLARWTTRMITIYGLCGIDFLNIFNCNDVVSRWVSIPRKRRRTGAIHKLLLENKEKNLLKYPFNPGSKTAIFKKNAFLFYLSTLGKFYLRKALKKDL